jgi:hypothetical protein
MSLSVLDDGFVQMTLRDAKMALDYANKPGARSFSETWAIEASSSVYAPEGGERSAVSTPSLRGGRP